MAWPARTLSPRWARTEKRATDERTTKAAPTSGGPPEDAGALVAKLRRHGAEPLEEERPEVEQLDLRHARRPREELDEVLAPAAAGRVPRLLSVAPGGGPPLEEAVRQGQDDERNHQPRLDDRQDDREGEALEAVPEDVQRVEQEQVEARRRVPARPLEEVERGRVLEAGDVERGRVLEDVARQPNLELVEKAPAGVPFRDLRQPAEDRQPERGPDPARTPARIGAGTARGRGRGGVHETPERDGEAGRNEALHELGRDEERGRCGSDPPREPQSPSPVGKDLSQRDPDRCLGSRTWQPHGRRRHVPASTAARLSSTSRARTLHERLLDDGCVDPRHDANLESAGDEGLPLTEPFTTESFVPRQDERRPTGILPAEGRARRDSERLRTGHAAAPRSSFRQSFPACRRRSAILSLPSHSCHFAQ